MKIIITKDIKLVEVLQENFKECLVLVSNEIEKVIEVFEV